MWNVVSPSKYLILLYLTFCSCNDVRGHYAYVMRWSGLNDVGRLTKIRILWGLLEHKHCYARTVDLITEMATEW